MRKYDSVLLGIVLGFLVPALVFVFVYIPIRAKGGSPWLAFGENMQLFMIVVNGIVIRFLFSSWDMEPTGKGMMAVTLLGALAWVIHNYL
jgi:hypothetical protein